MYDCHLNKKNLYTSFLFQKNNYVLDPHGAVGLLGLRQYLGSNKKNTGIFLETAHPCKFKSVVEETLSCQLELPDKLKTFMQREKQAIKMKADFKELKGYLLAGR